MSLKKQTGNRKIRQMHTAIVNAVIYHIWHARNSFIFHGKSMETTTIVKHIREKITQRVLHLHFQKENYSDCIEFISHRG